MAAPRVHAVRLTGRRFLCRPVSRSTIKSARRCTILAGYG
jgi:hypothetical protein